VKKAFLLLVLLPVVSADAATALFPKPLHLVKRVDDPFAKSAKTVDQYCYGNRIVTVAGDHVTILDYDAQTLTEIDHARATYSITRFDELANARPKGPAQVSSAGASPRVTPQGVKSSRSGRSVDSFDVEAPHTRVNVGVDRSVTLSRAAVEALIGASYPNVRRPEHDAILGAAGPAARGGRISANSTAGSDAAEYGLPSEQTVTVDSDGGAVTLRTSVLRFDADLPPSGAMLIEPGAKRIESPTARFAREMKDADTIPVAPRP
jgi:hypothetical protein